MSHPTGKQTRCGICGIPIFQMEDNKGKWWMHDPSQRNLPYTAGELPHTADPEYSQTTIP